MFWRSIITSLRWAPFKVNDEKLWKQIIRNIDAFLKNYDRRFVRNGALWNPTNPTEKPYYIKCDADLNPPGSHIVKFRWGLCIVDTAEVLEGESCLWDGGESQTP